MQSWEEWVATPKQLQCLQQLPECRRHPRPSSEGDDHAAPSQTRTKSSIDEHWHRGVRRVFDSEGVFPGTLGHLASCCEPEVRCPERARGRWVTQGLGGGKRAGGLKTPTPPEVADFADSCSHLPWPPGVLRPVTLADCPGQGTRKPSQP